MNSLLNRFVLCLLPLDVAITGAGIGGLATANALLVKNRASGVSVYEQASHFVPTTGAGFVFSPNG